jgi:CheY-like chemotaxis protein
MDIGKLTFVNTGLKLLVADDDEMSVLLIKNILKKACREVLIARTGIEAIELFEKNPDVDLVMMDMKMPKLNGYEATRQIRAINQNVVIIAQTSFALSGDREQALAAGCNDYLSKPIVPTQLLQMVQSYFEDK